MGHVKPQGVESREAYTFLNDTLAPRFRAPWQGVRRTALRRYFPVDYLTHFSLKSAQETRSRLARWQLTITLNDETKTGSCHSQRVRKWRGCYLVSLILHRKSDIQQKLRPGFLPTSR